MSGVTLADAKAAKERVQYTDPYADPATEPADPETINHSVRRQTRLAHPHFDVKNLPKPLVECGCGDCNNAVDPLAGDEHVFRDTVMAADVCDDPRPMTVDRAATAYYVYQTALKQRDDRTSALERTRQTHAAVLQSERELLGRWNSEATTALLSLRLSPIETVEEGVSDVNDDYYAITSTSPTTTDREQPHRKWIPPLQLDERLRDSWSNVRRQITRHLSNWNSEYLWVVSATESAATPHLHVYVWVRDPDDEITVEQFRPAVESFVRGTTGATQAQHPIDDGGDTGTVRLEHNPTMQDIAEMENGERQAIENYRKSDETDVAVNTAGLLYVMNQRPHWALEDTENPHSTDRGSTTPYERGAIEWASTNDWIGSSNGIDL